MFCFRAVQKMTDAKSIIHLNCILVLFFTFSHLREVSFNKDMYNKDTIRMLGGVIFFGHFQCYKKLLISTKVTIDYFLVKFTSLQRIFSFFKVYFMLKITCFVLSWERMVKPEHFWFACLLRSPIYGYESKPTEIKRAFPLILIGFALTWIKRCPFLPY